MTPDRLAMLALRMRTVQPNNPDHAGLSAWEPSRAYMFGENSRYTVRPVHGEECHRWEVRDRNTKPEAVVHTAATFAEAVERFL